MSWPIVALLISAGVLAYATWLARLLLTPRESERNAELLKRIASLEAKAKAFEGRKDADVPRFPFHMGAR